jgi:FkbM family methyltransferase
LNKKRFAGRVIREASGLAVRLFDIPFLHRYIISTVRFGCRLVSGGIYEGEVNGVGMKFYDPGKADSTYWASFYTKNRIYEHSATKHMQTVASQYESPTFVDVGAHYGYYTLYMSKLKEPAARVLSFEPSNEYFQVLSRNVKLNNAHNVSLYRLALSDKKGYIVLESSGTLRERGYPGERRKMRYVKEPSDGSQDLVAALPFDDLGLDVSPYIIKVDVHGAEGNVVTGMRRTLERGFGHLYCELHQEMCDGYTASDVAGMLQEAGMEIFELQSYRRSDGRLVKVSEDLFSRPEDRMIYARKLA